MVKSIKIYFYILGVEMKQSIKIVLLIGFVLSVYYVWNQYEMYQQKRGNKCLDNKIKRTV